MDNPSAFPIVVPIDFREAEPGMTLRDWLAGMAMQGLVAKHGENDRWRSIPAYAYAMADAMLAARQKGGEA